MITAEKQQVLRWFAEGRKAYKLADFATARDHFAQALTLDPEDGPSQVYHLRCQHYLENPPPEDWDGVFTMKTK